VSRLPWTSPPARPGVVHLVGAGPGDPGLLTLRAATLLATADVVAHDRLVPAAVLDLIPAHIARVAVGKPAPGTCGWRQEAISDLLVAEARAGRAVVRLKGGDPFVFGRGGEEAIRCHEAGIEVEVVPGVTSAVAAPAAAGIPVTHRGLASAVAFVTGHEDPDKPASQLDWAGLAAFPGTLVFLMGVHHAARIAEQLVLHGRDLTTPAAVVRWGTTDRQEELVSTLGELAADIARTGIASPATIVIGDVVRVRESLRGAAPVVDALAR
jgi:uroporphyrin-III C-methyltransferase